MLTVVWRTPICKPRYFWTIFTTLQLYNFTAFTSWTQSRIKGAEATTIRDYRREDILSSLTGISQNVFICIYVI